jgi:hypothetical protein
MSHKSDRRRIQKGSGSLVTWRERITKSITFVFTKNRTVVMNANAKQWIDDLSQNARRAKLRDGIQNCLRKLRGP